MFPKHLPERELWQVKRVISLHNIVVIIERAFSLKSISCARKLLILHYADGSG